MKWLVDRFLLNLRSKYYFKKSFWFHVLMMFLNDLIWVGLLLVLFTHSSVIAGFTQTQYIVMYAYTCVVFGFIVFFFGGLENLWSYIIEGNLDKFLVIPRNLVLNIAISDMGLSGLGDMLLGIFLICLLKPPLRLFLFFIGSAFLLFFYLLLASSVYFYIKEYSGTLSRQLRFFPFIAGIWPVAILPQPFKFIIFYILPGGTMFPYAVEQAYSGGWAPQLWLMCLIFSVVALFVFKKGLKKYQSSNLGINVNE